MIFQDYFTSVISGVTLGFLGSIHCVGMCGPLALSLPIRHLTAFQQTLAALMYNVGRIITYTFIGALLGFVGIGFSFFKIQQMLSIMMGLLLIFILINKKYPITRLSFIDQFTAHIQKQLQQLFIKSKNPFSYFAIGILNGFLPCGLIYIALISAVTAGSVSKSSIMMFSFGLGTLPLMLATMLVGRFISQSMRSFFLKLAPFFIISIATILILRGLNLGIPYISPSIETNSELKTIEDVRCH